ncbi:MULTISPECIES: AAA family ATPase [Streptomyces]|uniref:Thymidylate kinase n=1 Tax=Streptomyces yunnanensis TaxID=156453 RepID=A0A9X8MN71_9ACTN|nr:MULTISPECIES: AAA family ATPase [Streptomyces]SHL16962.1 Thymidylate kinase [Streptomyces yunnanensis]
MHSEAAYATTAGTAPESAPEPAPAGPRAARRPRPTARPDRVRITDLRDGARAPRTALRFAPGDLIVVSGLPGSGKSTLMQRVLPTLDGRGDPVYRIDSQDSRERWERGRLRHLPYALYRPLVRAAHYRALRRALRTGGSVVVHDCGTLAWVRRWLARTARRDGRGLHLVLLDVPPGTALGGQRARGRGVSRYAFARHRRAVRRLVARAEEARLPAGFRSAVLLDRSAAGVLERVTFTARAGVVRARPGGAPAADVTGFGERPSGTVR